MRILHVSQPLDAGVPAVVSALVSDEVRRGYEVHTASPSRSVLGGLVLADGGHVHTWEAARSPGPGTIGEAVRLGRIVDRVDPDLVVLHSAKAGMAGRLAVRGRRTTVVVPHAWSFSSVQGPLALAASRWERWASRWTHLVVCVSSAELARGRAAGVRAPAVVIDNGTELGTADRPTPVQARHDLGLHEAPTAVCVGRLAPQKGQDLLLDAWPEIVRRVPDARLLVVGDGPSAAALRARAPADVVFTGARTDVPALLAAADVVVVPSRWEGAALVPLEAMAASRPVVSFDVDGMAHALGNTGAVVPCGDVPALAAAVAARLSDPGSARMAGLAARRRVEEHFDLRTALGRWDRELRALVARPGGPSR
ncbi:glycosyltransferase [Klenkia sp. LSe6-5]|uniref:Glycosyltransferase n=1 Tax=Klenkia sesuvii TaxID=3103137 RepID=A0ABU8DWJ5_9ACTN